MSAFDHLTHVAARRLEALLWRTPQGTLRAALPWDSLDDGERHRLPWVLRLRPYLGVSLLLIGGLFSLCGWLVKSHGLFAVGTGLLFLSTRAYLQAWRRLGALRIELQRAPESVTVGEDVAVALELTHAAKGRIPRVVVYGVFNGAAEPECYASEADVVPQVKRRVLLRWRADVGMGQFLVEGFKCVVGDDLGLFQLAADLPIEAKVAVEPTAAPLTRFPIRESGSATDAGAFEARGVGDAVTFRGLRPWRIGDGMRRIDWKRSQRVGALLVKEFERIASTQATLFFDISAANHSQFGGLSTFNSLRDAVLALADWLTTQRIKTRLVTAPMTLPLGPTAEDALLLRDLLREMTPRHDAELTALMERHLLDVQTDSLVVIFACAANVSLDSLWNTLIHLDERRCEIVLVLADTGSFANQIQRQLRLEDWERPVVRALAAEANASSRSALSALAAKLLARTYVLGPTASLASMATERRL